MIKKLKNEDETAAVEVELMKAIGEIIHIDGNSNSIIIDEILPIVIKMLENVTCFAKRQVSN